MTSCRMSFLLRNCGIPVSVNDSGLYYRQPTSTCPRAAESVRPRWECLKLNQTPCWTSTRAAWSAIRLRATGRDRLSAWFRGPRSGQAPPAVSKIRSHRPKPPYPLPGARIGSRLLRRRTLWCAAETQTAWYFLHLSKRPDDRAWPSVGLLQVPPADVYLPLPQICGAGRHLGWWQGSGRG